MSVSPPPPAHPMRRLVLDEVHARPFQDIEAPRRVLLMALATTEPGAYQQAWEALDAWCAATSAPRPDPGAKFHRAVFPNASLRFESHSEFTSWTWDIPAERPDFGWPPADPPPFMTSFTPPGRVMVGVDLVLRQDEGGDFPFEQLFEPMSLSVSAVHHGGALIATDFRQDARGNTRILVLDRGLGPVRAGALVQRLLEIETYRSFALLGLPEASRLSPILTRIEQTLLDGTRRMVTTMGLEGNAKLLDELVVLAAEAEAEAAASSYRFAATRAYDAIVTARLDSIREAALDGYGTWRSFLERRMAPAMRTCQAVATRQADLTGKLQRAADLLRTRVEVDMQSANKAMLEALNERAKLQLRLQQTVEGLSVAAVSYYVLGLLGYLFKGAHEAHVLRLDPGLATALAVPFVVALVWWTVRRVRRLHRGPGEP